MTLVSIYDPIIDAYRQIPIENAKKFVAEAPKIQKTIEQTEKEAKIRAKIEAEMKGAK